MMSNLPKKNIVQGQKIEKDAIGSVPQRRSFIDHLKTIVGKKNRITYDGTLAHSHAVIKCPSDQTAAASNPPDQTAVSFNPSDRLEPSDSPNQLLNEDEDSDSSSNPQYEDAQPSIAEVLSYRPSIEGSQHTSLEHNFERELETCPSLDPHSLAVSTEPSGFKDISDDVTSSSVESSSLSEVFTSADDSHPISSVTTSSTTSESNQSLHRMNLNLWGELGDGTIIPHTKGRYYSFDSAKIPKAAYDRFSAAFDAFSKARDEDFELRKRWKDITFELRVIGKDEADAKPQMLISYSQDLQAKLRKSFSKQSVARHSHGLGVIYRAVPYRPQYTASEHGSNVFEDTTITACGMLVNFEGRQATVTLSLDVDGSFYHLLAGHIFPPFSPLTSRAQLGNIESEQMRKLSTGYALEPTSVPTLRGKEDDSFKDLDHDPEHVWIEDLDDNLCPNENFGELGLLEHANYYSDAASFKSSRPSSTTPIQQPVDVTSWQVIQPEGGDHFPTFESDWALLRDPKHLRPPNIIFPEGPTKPKFPDTIAKEDPLQSLDVVMVSGVYGYRSGMLASGLSYIGAPNGTNMLRVRRMALYDDQGISKGESGSMVVVKGTWEIIGYVVASNCEGLGYVLPLGPVLEQIKVCLRAQSVTLPSALPLLVEKELCDLHARSTSMSPTTMAFDSVVRREDARLMIILLSSAANPSRMNSKYGAELRYAIFYNLESMYSLSLRQVSVTSHGDDIHAGILHAAACVDDVGILKKLLEHGANVDAIEGKEETALQVAAIMGHYEATYFLWSSGANVDHQDAFGRTALHFAACGVIRRNRAHIFMGISGNGKTELAPMLPFTRSRTSITRASEYSYYSVTALLMQLGSSIEHHDSSGWTPLHFACSRGHAKIAELLLEKGANPHVRDIFGRTPLHLACSKARQTIARVLLDQGQDIECADILGWTPLFYCCATGNVDLARLLIQNGADVDAQDFSGKTVLSVASREGHDEIVRLLLLHGLKDHRQDGSWLLNNAKWAIQERTVLSSWTQSFTELSCRTWILDSESKPRRIMGNQMEFSGGFVGSKRNLMTVSEPLWNNLTQLILLSLILDNVGERFEYLAEHLSWNLMRVMDTSRKVNRTNADFKAELPRAIGYLSLGLRHLHKDKFIRYTDLLPDNILYHNDRQVNRAASECESWLWVGFGSSSSFQSEQAILAMRLDLIGNSIYALPERGNVTTHGRTFDIYTYGCILVEAITFLIHEASENTDSHGVRQSWPYKNPSKGLLPEWFEETRKKLTVQEDDCALRQALVLALKMSRAEANCWQCISAILLELQRIGNKYNTNIFCTNCALRLHKMKSQLEKQESEYMAKHRRNKMQDITET